MTQSLSLADLRAALEAGTVSASEQSAFGQSPLYAAVRANDVPRARLLLEFGAQFDPGTLRAAVAADDLAMLRLVPDAQLTGEPDALGTCTDVLGMVPCHLAGAVATLEYLVDERGCRLTPACLAKATSAESLEVMLRAGGAHEVLGSAAGAAAICELATHQKWDRLQLLVAVAPLDVTAPTSAGATGTTAAFTRRVQQPTPREAAAACASLTVGEVVATQKGAPPELIKLCVERGTPVSAAILTRALETRGNLFEWLLERAPATVRASPALIDAAVRQRSGKLERIQSVLALPGAVVTSQHATMAMGASCPTAVLQTLLEAAQLSGSQLTIVAGRAQEPQHWHVLLRFGCCPNFNQLRRMQDEPALLLAVVEQCPRLLAPSREQILTAKTMVDAVAAGLGVAVPLSAGAPLTVFAAVMIPAANEQLVLDTLGSGEDSLVAHAIKSGMPVCPSSLLAASCLGEGAEALSALVAAAGGPEQIEQATDRVLSGQVPSTTGVPKVKVLMAGGLRFSTRVFLDLFTDSGPWRAVVMAGAQRSWLRGADAAVLLPPDALDAVGVRIGDAGEAVAHWLWWRSLFLMYVRLSRRLSAPASAEPLLLRRLGHLPQRVRREVYEFVIPRPMAPPEAPAPAPAPAPSPAPRPAVGRAPGRGRAGRGGPRGRR